MRSSLPISLKIAMTVAGGETTIKVEAAGADLLESAPHWFSIDGQPVSDQQSKVFSTQLPLDAVQSMELITGPPGVEYGDKTSLGLPRRRREPAGSSNSDEPG